MSAAGGRAEQDAKIRKCNEILREEPLPSIIVFSWIASYAYDVAFPYNQHPQNLRYISQPRNLPTFCPAALRRPSLWGNLKFSSIVPRLVS